MRTVCAAVLVISTLAGLRAQEPGGVFRSGVDVVSLNVVVTGAQGKFLRGLGTQDFAVFEDGIPQPVSFFASMPVPIDLAILLDTSASMAGRMSTVQQAAIGFTSPLRPSDRLTVVGIKDTVKILHPLNEDVAAARAAIASTRAGGSTSLYNGLYMTLRDMMKHRPSDGGVRRQAIVVLSDGVDTTSLVGFDDVMELAKKSGVAIYTITLRAPAADPLRGPALQQKSEFSMKAIAQETGARAFFPVDIKELAGIYNVIAEELANQYLLGYTSTNGRLDGAYRRVSIRVEQPGARARVRAGYFAPQMLRSRTADAR